MGVLERNNVTLTGRPDGPAMLFAHGFGCDQHMWRFVSPAFEAEYRIVLFDHVSAGGSDLSSFDPARYGTLHGYATDVLEICAELELSDSVFVGHSVSSIIGVLAAIDEPARFSKLVLVSPSPRYLDDTGYTGGFTHEDLGGLVEALDSNYLGWSSAMAPGIMGTPDRPELSDELTHSFCRTDPQIAKHFARVTFLSDNRADLARLGTPTLVLQCQEDAIAPMEVGTYVAQQVPDSTLVVLDATGHCPNLSAPEQTVAAMRAFLDAPGGTIA